MSAEGFLYAVSIAGLSLLADDVDRAAARATPLLGIARAYLRFCFERPALFRLMFQYPFDWRRLRELGALDTGEGLRAWRTVVAVFERQGSCSPADDARVFHAALHGVATLTLAGRMSTSDVTRSDRRQAELTVRHLATTFGTTGVSRSSS